MAEELTTEQQDLLIAHAKGILSEFVAEQEGEETAPGDLSLNPQQQAVIDRKRQEIADLELSYAPPTAGDLSYQAALNEMEGEKGFLTPHELQSVNDRFGKA